MVQPITERLRKTYDDHDHLIMAALVTLAAAGVVLLLPPVQALAAIIGIGFFVLLLRMPGFGLYMIVASVPLQDVVRAPLPIAIGASGNTTITQLLVIATSAAWLLRKILVRQSFVLPRVRYYVPARPSVAEAPRLLRLAPLYAPILLYLCAQIVSLVSMTSIRDSLNEFSRWVIAFFVYALAVETLRTRRDMLRLVGVVCAGAAFEAFYGLIQAFFSLGPASFALGTSGLFRGSGTFGAPNSYAGYLEMCFGIVLALNVWAWRRRGTDTRAWLNGLDQPRNRRTRWNAYFRANGVALALTGLSLVLAAAIIISSRGGTLGLAAAVAVMIVALGKRGVPMLILAGMLALGIVVAVALEALPSAITDRVGSITTQLTPFDTRHAYIDPDNFAVVERMAMWQAGMAMFESNPVTGVGIGNYNSVYSRFAMPQFPESRGHAHNYYIHTMAETGLIGLAAWLFLLGAAFATTFRTLRLAARLAPDDGLMATIAWGVLGVLAAITVHDLVENLHVLNMSLHLFALLGLVYAVQRAIARRITTQALG